MKEKKQDLMKYLKQMVEIRFFEEKIYDLMARNLIEGASHNYIGEEAIAVGACAAIRQDDYITSTHRGHGHCIAKGAKLDLMMAEVMGKATGYCKGRGGSMHIADVNTGNLGATGMVGGNIPIATGAGVSIQMRKTDQVCLCFFGDGANNTGAFHESLNMAGVWKLPVIYICENNLYGMSVSVERACAVKDISQRASGYNMPGAIVDGMDVLAVKHSVEDAVDRARKGKGPSLIEAKTYRFYGHSRSDAKVYRTRQEEEAWKKKCPVLLFTQKLIKEKLATEQEIKALEDDVRREIDTAEKFAVESPWPNPAELSVGLYVES